QYRGKAFARDGQRRRRVRQDKFWVRSETVQDLVGPEALQTMQRLVEHTEFVGIDAAGPLDRAHVFLIQRVDEVAHLASLVGEPDAHRGPIDARALMIEEPHLDELLEIVRNVRAEIVTARAQLAGSELSVADILEQQRLD